MRTLKQCYNKLRLDENQIYEMLLFHYKNEVARFNPQMQDMNELASVAKWLNMANTKPWLIIYGKIGNGKSTTAVAIRTLYHALLNSVKSVYTDPCHPDNQLHSIILESIAALRVPYMISAQELCEICIRSQEEYEKYKNYRFLIIDDVGIEPYKIMRFGTEICPIEDVLYQRYASGQMTILTTNLDTKQLYSRYGDRVANRLKQFASRIGYNAESYR
ncbi:MAG: hypothetical protein R3Y26_02055 [Rikenellaceae bacterium]